MRVGPPGGRPATVRGPRMERAVPVTAVRPCPDRLTGSLFSLFTCLAKMLALVVSSSFDLLPPLVVRGFDFHVRSKDQLIQPMSGDWPDYCQSTCSARTMGLLPTDA